MGSIDMTVRFTDEVSTVIDKLSKNNEAIIELLTTNADLLSKVLKDSIEVV